MDHTKELIALAHDGNREARDIVVLENMGLVYSIAKRFGGRGYDIEDIKQIGTIGLIKAIDKFDLEQPVMFSTYAVPMITGEIKRFIRDDGMVKVSRTVKENLWKLKSANEKLLQRNGEDATLEELSGETGIPVEDIVVAFSAGREVESIYQTVYQSDGNSVYMLDRLSQDVECSDHEKILDNLVIKQVFDALDDTEKSIITMRYFEDKTQTDIAKKLGISQVQVSRLEKRTLLRLRKLIES